MDSIIPMKPSLIQRFYEPIVLLKALNMEMTSMAEHTNPATSANNSNPEERFQIFVYKLAYVCDNVKGRGGATVTSFMITQDEEHGVQFRFASNQRTEEELEETAFFIRTLLQMIGKGLMESQVQKKALHTNLLRHVLLFNQTRVTSYLQNVRTEARKCLEKCSYFSGEERTRMTADFERFLEVFVKIPTATAIDVHSFERVLDGLEKLDRSSSGKSLSTLARQVRGSPNESPGCWPEMRHMMGRLLAYREAINYFLAAKRTWPQLFENPLVYFITSSKPIPKPGRNKSFSADSIIGRMTNENEKIEAFREFVEDLQLYNLDDRIKTQYSNPGFHPVVHSEVLLLDFLKIKGPIHPARFFQGWMYIGSSKPSCKLCHYYFEEHTPKVGHRPTHGNLYISWRVPDVLTSQGNTAGIERRAMIDKILARVRNDAFNLILKRVKPTHRIHDSVTSSARLTHSRSWVSASIDDVTSMVGDLDISENIGSGSS
ncbi:hypothetical protein S7711_09592 [Stachybotrys chartarum IBT 7711]|uniref:Uncharacterized protein n=1 Tax=Stachybotrys chartarum (strain CBS 109288 / IBT 7711) TaxID=1280523 RepID=A0A084B6B5_STACB|nr:hypothetical protein S7711_09592 [Stachybotrys chartarum IBT 7711]